MSHIRYQAMAQRWTRGMQVALSLTPATCTPPGHLTVLQKHVQESQCGATTSPSPAKSKKNPSGACDRTFDRRSRPCFCEGSTIAETRSHESTLSVISEDGEREKLETQYKLH
jgi:hypothetical protein